MALNRQEQPIVFESYAEKLAALKHYLIERQYKYEFAAKKVGVSVATVVRMVNRHELKPLIAAAKAGANPLPEQKKYTIEMYLLDVKTHYPEDAKTVYAIYRQLLENHTKKILKQTTNNNSI